MELKKEEEEEDEVAVETCQPTKDLKHLARDEEGRRRYGRKQKGKRESKRKRESSTKADYSYMQGYRILRPNDGAVGRRWLLCKMWVFPRTDQGSKGREVQLSWSVVVGSGPSGSA